MTHTLPGEGATVEALLDAADQALNDLNVVLEAVRAALELEPNKQETTEE